MKTFTLNNGVVVPQVGLGTLKPRDFDGDFSETVLTAMEVGFRYIDTAALYKSERDVGKAIVRSGLKRNELQVASKAWIDQLGYDGIKTALHQSLERLQLDYLDFYFIHWPKRTEDDFDWEKNIEETYRALEEMQAEGLIKNICLSNFLPHHIEAIKKFINIKPVMDQLELHPGYSQEKAIDYLAKENILAQSWGPMSMRGTEPKSDMALLRIAEKYGVSKAQLSLNFILRKGIMAIPASVNKTHLEENFKAGELEISKEDMSMLECMPQTAWRGEHPDFSTPKGKSTTTDQ